MADRRGRDPATTPRATPEVEATSYGPLFGLVSAGGLVVGAWLAVRARARRRARR